MGSSYTRHEFVLSAVGQRWWVTGIGTSVVLLYVISAFFLRGVEIWGTTALYAGGAVGGVVAGFVLGTNVYDGLVAGLRAGIYGLIALSVVGAVTLFVLWYSNSGDFFFYWVPLYGFVGFVGFVPVYAITGMVSGAVGVLARRVVVPDHLNPDPY
ncbi:hypothetical protein [Halapricum hydrolyticum]|uniref:DUF5518 domain-containing protein n=1 Tax=Halapricum hydrolyticum TaxID=2979991 RepID=A0AAE3IB86_9EURY|nr:hypothetical protein [Halapricum hydrolyticum]MCU4719158.1 hypothetical protein [Halapricum hydrolyticum]MCU4727348.1 hypothetical protein [Halapricum hydrolyticum]